MGLAGRNALVLTVSDGVSAGTRQDVSGDAVHGLLEGAGFEVDRAVVPDEIPAITAAIEAGLPTARLIVTTGGTGLGPRDVTPEATARLVDREVPGLAHLMMARGLESTPMAALSRAGAGAIGSTLVINLPGSARGATESLGAVLDVIPHALDLLAGDTEHR